MNPYLLSDTWKGLDNALAKLFEFRVKLIQEWNISNVMNSTIQEF